MTCVQGPDRLGLGFARASKDQRVINSSASNSEDLGFLKDMQVIGSGQDDLIHWFGVRPQNCKGILRAPGSAPRQNRKCLRQRVRRNRGPSRVSCEYRPGAMMVHVLIIKSSNEQTRIEEMDHRASR